MKKTLLIVSFFWFTSSFSQSNEIYGISRGGQSSFETYLAKLDTVNGMIEDVSDTSYAEFINAFGYTVDSDLGIYYFSSNTNHIIGIDMNTGEKVSEVPIVTSQRPIFSHYIYNEITQEIIGLETGGGVGSGVLLSKINPNTGIVQTISQSPIAYTISGHNFTLDLLNQWYHLITASEIITIDIASGDVVYQETLDNDVLPTLHNLCYNAADGLLYALGTTATSTNQTFLVTVNPTNGEVDIISSASLGQYIAYSGRVIDPYAEIFYYMRPYPMSFVGVDMNTGNEVSSTPFDFSTSNGNNFGNFYFGGVTQVLILSNTQFEDEFQLQLHPNPATNFVSLQGDFIDKVALFSLTGKKLKQWNFTNQKDVQLDVSMYSQGIYFLKVEGQNKATKTLKLVKR